ncbi:MAG: hypothetical protein NT160_03735 [Actinobacteria bacterium]|nr:hypothetical protein [Actinomycetota bacterium]
MPLALLTTTSGAAAAKPTITSVTVNAAVEGDVDGGFYGGGGTVGYQNAAVIHVTGTTLNTNLMNASGTGAVTISSEAGFANFLGGPTGDWTITSVTGKSATGFTIHAMSPNITFSLLGGGAVSKGITTFKLASNCGPVPATGDPATNLPVNADTGAAYADADFGSGAMQQATQFKDYLQTKPSAYVDVTVLATAALGAIPIPPLLCASDMGLTPPITSTSTFGANGYYTWAKNYNLYMSGNVTPALLTSQRFIAIKNGAAGVGKVKGLTFSLPYTSATTVDVSANTSVYTIPKGMTIGSCAAGDSTSNANLAGITGHHYLWDNGSTTCTVNAMASTITIVDSANHSFTKGEFLDSPAVNLNGVSVAKAGTFNFLLKSITTTIALSGNVIDIAFNPAAKSASAKATVFSVVVS